MENIAVEKVAAEEKCSICGKLMNDGEGRFCTPDQIYCTSCCYKRNSGQNAEEVDEEHE